MMPAVVRRGAQVLVVVAIVMGGASSSELRFGVRSPAQPLATAAPPEAPEATGDEPATAPRERAADAAAKLVAQTKRLRSRVERLTALPSSITRGERVRLEDVDARCPMCRGQETP